ncbi:(2Fe-2S) ferredoxin domain-containing protein [Selenihalanaerobacter shriftii]|uniref:NAD(P)-dependent iron-only hydrogenase iron-sulfur protein n=1 Tax=Selenihalanaerobacter shriftii TaxID=142842 RepID=A0A1T4K7A6_9FIRM|nr:(2Fe-2S) ferredoxin domain-containing protein [Selenihalanaerobacter shriftii]SJZ38227.1 NAD(P)-dependent iron-only hydrogenase iron-sulfur protein [Selenihalanaerobacter shriftii]
MESLAKLKESREKFSKELELVSEKPQIIIGFGTCGIAAGARKILTAIETEVEERELDVAVSQTGCIGLCEKEPLVDIKLPGEDRVTYGNLSVDDVEKIIAEHVIEGKVVENLAIARLED